MLAPGLLIKLVISHSLIYLLSQLGLNSQSVIFIQTPIQAFIQFRNKTYTRTYDLMFLHILTLALIRIRIFTHTFIQTDSHTCYKVTRALMFIYLFILKLNRKFILLCGAFERHHRGCSRQDVGSRRGLCFGRDTACLGESLLRDRFFSMLL